MVTKTAQIGVLCLILLILPGTQLKAKADQNSRAETKQRQEIRFYKINKDGITQRLRFTTKKSRSAGCHNLVKRGRLHRAMQFGYGSCQIFAKKDCDATSLMTFKREKETEVVSDLTQGYGWLPIGEHERGEHFRSWHCE
ncbi:hypothetical protein [Arenicella xantha]|uniref:Uncharacterized protein n=1 Tax=Arenicella xantha TaxID=644221 RepID=A0A395JV31_9GAMM|nr:hypothetical protein [Arenicella xantha]RBP53408.1 hypothetical protein DFR28_101794 [Arenicella xantha]